MPLSIPPPPEPIEIGVTQPHAHDSTLYTLLQAPPPDEGIGHPRESYFRNLTTIEDGQRYTLPSNNKFMIDREGIHLHRSTGNELWEISAENKGATVVITDLSYTAEGRRCCIQGKKWGVCIDQDPQVLGREEIAHIFYALDQGKPYRRPTYKPDGSPYKIILVVQRKS